MSDQKKLTELEDKMLRELLKGIEVSMGCAEDVVYYAKAYKALMEPAVMRRRDTGETVE